MMAYVRVSTRLTRSTGHDATAMRAHTAPSEPSALHASAVRLRKRRHQMAAAVCAVQQSLVDALPAMAIHVGMGA